MNPIKITSKKFLTLLSVISGFLFLASCQPGDNNPGYEYMPDMAHSVAYEANYSSYYSLNQFVSEKDYRKYAMPKSPVAGTRSMGQDAYYYPNTEEGRARASAELIMAKTPITEKGLERGKYLFNIYCAICHGEKGNGEGYLVREDGGKFPAQPADFTLDKFINATNGQLYHAIKYGKNVMAGYGDKLNPEERWDVIHYIRSLQAKVKGKEYSANKNTLNDWAIPAHHSSAE